MTVFKGKGRVIREVKRKIIYMSVYYGTHIVCFMRSHTITTTICTTTADRIAAHYSLPVRDLNSNGIIRATDAIFQSLRVWLDLNQVGIFQANEMCNLGKLGIQSLDVAYKDANKNLGNGNTLAQQGSYTKTDGTTAQVGDLLLAVDNLYSRFVERVELTAEQTQAAGVEMPPRMIWLKSNGCCFCGLHYFYNLTEIIKNV